VLNSPGQTPDSRTFARQIHGTQMSVNTMLKLIRSNEQASPTLPSQGAGGTTAPRAAAFTHTVCSMQSAPHSAGNGGASSSPGCESQQGPPLGTSSRTSELAPPLMVIQFYKSRSNRAGSIEGSRCCAEPHVEYLARRRALCNLIADRVAYSGGLRDWRDSLNGIPAIAI